MSKSPLVAVGVMLAAILAVLTAGFASALDFSVLDLPNDRDAVEMEAEAGEIPDTGLHLEVFINGVSTRLLAAVRQEQDGKLTIDPTVLRNVGIVPAAEALRSDGRIDVTLLPDVAAWIDWPTQSLYFDAPDEARVPLQVSARPSVDDNDPRHQVQTGLGALLNYSLSANGLYDFDSSDFSYGGLSGRFEGRLFSPMGIFNNSVALSGGEFRRLDTSWTYSDPNTLTTYTAGDLITRGPTWTRPARLGGFQIGSNFNLRSGLITMPVPGFSGSAGVPSTVDLFLNNSRRFSRDIPAGPFEMVDMPVVTGQGTARVVVRDEDGNETVTESDYFVSDRLLRPGLLDYSVEAGFPRTGYGTPDDRYDERLFASASIRYGVSDWLTLEGHAEGGEDLINGGMGLVAGLGSWGVGSLAASGSLADGEQGFQLSGALEMQVGSVRLQGRLQQTFGAYNDIVSVSAPQTGEFYNALWSEVPRTLGQVSVSMPILDTSYLNLSYTHLEHDFGETNQLLSASYSQPLFGGTFTASGFTDLNRDRHGLFASFSMPLGGGMSASSGVSASGDDFGYRASVSQSPKPENNNFGWQVTYQQADDPRFGARGDIQTDVARFGGTARYSNDAAWLSGRVSGAVVAAGGGVFLTNRIEDAFGIVDAGAPGVAVLRENRPVGETGGNGMLIVPNLRSYERNMLGLDPNTLPLDVAIASTRQVVVPADRTGVVVSFGTHADGGTAIVEFKDSSGMNIEVGTQGLLDGGEAFMIGYDGEAFLTGLGASNSVMLVRPNGTQCTAHFNYVREAGSQVRIPDVICQTQ